MKTRIKELIDSISFYDDISNSIKMEKCQSYALITMLILIISFTIFNLNLVDYAYTPLIMPLILLVTLIMDLKKTYEKLKFYRETVKILSEKIESLQQEELGMYNKEKLLKKINKIKKRIG